MVKILKNSDGEIYFFQQEIENPEEAEKFLRGFWAAVNPQIESMDNILRECTDRGQGVRSRYSQPLLNIFSYGWIKEDDTKTLPLAALEFLNANADLEA